MLGVGALPERPGSTSWTKSSWPTPSSNLSSPPKCPLGNAHPQSRKAVSRTRAPMPPPSGALHVHPKTTTPPAGAQSRSRLLREQAFWRSDHQLVEECVLRLRRGRVGQGASVAGMPLGEVRSPGLPFIPAACSPLHRKRSSSRGLRPRWEVGRQAGAPAGNAGPQAGLHPRRGGPVPAPAPLPPLPPLPPPAASFPPSSAQAPAPPPGRAVLPGGLPGGPLGGLRAGGSSPLEPRRSRRMPTRRGAQVSARPRSVSLPGRTAEGQALG